MQTFIQMIFGSLSFLKTYQARAAHPLLLMRPLTGGSYALLDPSGHQKFALPQRYQVLAANGAIQPTGLVQLRYFQLTPEEAPVFIDAAKTVVAHQPTRTNNAYASVMVATKTHELILMTQWQTTTAKSAAQATPAFAAIDQFAHRAAKGAGYHEAYYQIEHPDADA